MLHWFNGTHQEPSRPTDDEATDEVAAECHEDAPETPAPLFAVRAFKQAIWGTPKPSDTVKRPFQPRRRTSRGEARIFEAGAPPVTRNRTDARRENARDSTPINSPAKRPGILLTPGTAGKGRKSVSFEARQRALHSKQSAALDVNAAATPRDVPGRFPSPRVSNEQPIVPAAASKESNKLQGPPSSSQTGARISTADHKKPPTKQQFLFENDDDRNHPRDADSKPSSPSAAYWKSTHEAYARRTEIQMRKLVKKEEVAKKYAKFKDEEALRLKEELEEERSKVERLEARVNEYVRRLEGATGATVASERRKSGSGSIRELNSIREKQKDSEASKSFHVGATAEAKAERPADFARATLPYRTTAKRSDRLDATGTASRPRTSHQFESTSKKLDQSHVSSDIWADIGDPLQSIVDVSASIQAMSTRSAHGTLRRASNPRDRSTAMRQPLGPASGNILDSKTEGEGEADAKKENGKDAAPAVGRMTTMTEERKEAARKRLEEKRRMRKKSSVAAALAD